MTMPEVVQADVYLLIAYIALAILFSFACSIAEAVLLSITPSYIQSLHLENPALAKRLKRLRIDNVDQSLAAILTLNTIAHTVGAIVAGAKATHVFGDAWIGLFSAAMTVAILFFSEIVPKTIGAVYWKSLAGITATFVAFLIKALYPLIWLSESITKWISKGKKQHIFSRDEFLAMANLGQKTGDIEEHESRVIANLMNFNSVKVEDIMTPRRVIYHLPSQKTVSEVFEQVVDGHFSRIPIFDNDSDDIKAFVLKSDILLAKAKDQHNLKLRELKRDLWVVLDKMTVPRVVEMLIEQRQHMALVVDEYGDPRGLVTLEDIFETLIGIEIMDEVDQVQDLQILAREQWLKRAKARGTVVEQSEKE